MLAVVIDGDTQVVIPLTVIGAVAVMLYRVARVALRARDQTFEALRRVQVMWTAYVDRGKMEAEKSGVIEDPNAVGNVIPRQVRNLFAPKTEELRRTYWTEWAGLPENEAKFQIEARFGGWMVQEVCKPLGWHSGQCLHAALLIAREPPGWAPPDSKTMFRPGLE